MYFFKKGIIYVLIVMGLKITYAQDLPKNLFPNQNIYNLDLLLQKEANLGQELPLSRPKITNLWILDDTIQMAMANNLELAQTKKALDAAKALYTGTIQDFYVPSLSTSLSFSTRDLFTTSKNAVIIEETSQGFTMDLVLPSITLSKNIFNGFANLYSYRIAKETHLNAQNTYSNKIREIVYQTTIRYYDQFLRKDEVEVSLERLRQLKSQLEQAEINYQNGLVSDYDVTLSKSQFFAAQPVYFSSEKERLYAREDFYRYIGYIPNNQVYVELQGSLLQVTNLEFTKFDEDSSLEYILSNDTALATLRTAYINARNTKGQKNSVRLPKLAVQFDYTPSYGRDVAIGNFKEAAYNGSYGVGASLQIPILDWIPGTGVASQVQAAEENIKKAQFALLDAEEQKIIEIKKVLLSIRELNQSVSALRISEQQAGLASEIARKQYQNGRISILELNLAQVDYIDAKKQLLNSVYREFQSKLILQEAMNNLSAFLDEVSKIQENL